jgi:hypothetical protein
VHDVNFQQNCFQILQHFETFEICCKPDNICALFLLNYCETTTNYAIYMKCSNNNISILLKHNNMFEKQEKEDKNLIDLLS